MGEKIENTKNQRKPVKISLNPIPLLFNRFLREGTCLMIALSSLLINYLHWHLKSGSSHESGLKFFQPVHPSPVT